MKKSLLSVFRFVIGFLLIINGFQSLKAQTMDTTVFDYDSYTGCLACGDFVKYGDRTKDSITDATPSGYYYTSIVVKVKQFSCYSGAVDLYLNGTVVGTSTANYICSCNTCDSITFSISTENVSKYYKYGTKNYFEVKLRSSSTIYFDRTIIYRTRVKRMNYDAGINAVDSPMLYTCKGSKNIVVKVQNNGRKQFSGVDVEWRWNGVSQTTASYSGTVDTLNGSGSNKVQVKLGSKSFTVGKSDTLMAWTKNPGGVTDSANFNDTIRYIFNTGYSDTLTVGGSSPDFSTIQDAMNALISKGVCGPVWVKIRPGTYNEQLILSAIPNTSTTNTVTFLPSNNDSSSVIITYGSSSSSSNYTLKLSNVSNVKFYKLTFVASGTSYGIVVHMQDHLVNLSFSNCEFRGINTTSTSSRYRVLYRFYNTGYESTTNFKLLNSRIAYGSYGVYMYNGYYTFSPGFTISGCVIENQTYMNTYLGYINNATIQKNTLERNTSSSTSGYGLYIENCYDSLNVTGNKIIQRNGGTAGIYLYSAQGGSGKSQLVGNNAITVNSSGYSYNGIYLYYCNYVDLVFNSIYSKSVSNSNNYGVYVYEGSNNRILNNCIQNAGLGYAFNVTSSSKNSVRKSDRNNYYNGGKTLGSFYGNSINSVTDLHPLGMDTFSVSSNPNYTAFDDLHPYSVDMDGKARPFKGLGVDLDNNARNSTTPDIGAYEFKLAGLDIGIPEGIPVASGSQCYKVVLKNQGNTTVTSAKIDWVVNGTKQTQVNWTGTLAKGDTDIVCLGTVNFKRDTLYVMKVWSSAPNGGTDSIASNDTLKYQFYPFMRGVYTIGGTSPDFATFNAAVTAMELSGVIDSVYFKVRDGSYTEQIHLDNIIGPNKKNAIIFESESKDKTKVTLQYGSSSSSSNNYVIDLLGTNGVSFRNMTLTNSSTGSYKTVIKLESSSGNVTFENNLIQNFDSTSTSWRMYLVYIEYNKGKNIEFNGNTFRKGSYALYIYGDNSQWEKGVTIKNNTFDRQTYYTIEGYYISDLEIAGNNFTINNPNAYGSIELGDLNGQCKIYNNRINVNGSNIWAAFYIYYYYSSTDTCQIYNNFISIASNQDGIGLYADDLYPGNISYNNILNESTDSTGTSAALYINWGKVKVRNNNLVHLKNGYAYYIYRYDYLFSNYNNLYTNGSSFVYHYGDYHGDLNDYSTNTGFDTSSLSVDPQYTSFSDLHVAASAVNGKGKPVNGITKDIDNETRNTTTPDIGADEFTPATLDAGVKSLLSPGSLFAADTIPVKVVVYNFGIDTIKKVTVQVKVNQDTLSRKISTRVMASGDTAHVFLGNYIFKKDSTYNFTAWTSLPNGSTDQKRSNDTLRVLNILPAMSGVYTIGGSSPDFTTFTKAIDAMKKAGVLDSVRFRVRQGTYTEQLTIPAIKGVTNANTVIFESQDVDTTKVVLQYNSTKYDSNYVVHLFGADGITFRYMTLKSLNSSYGVVVRISQKAENNTIHKNIIEGNKTSGSSSDMALIYSPSDADHNLTISGNIIKYGDFAMYLDGSATSSPYNNENMLTISGNRIYNPFYSALYLFDMDTALIRNNYIYMDRNYNSYGIYTRNFRRFEITGNQIIMPIGYLGIYPDNCGTGSYYRRSLIANNFVYLKNNSTSLYGLYIYYTDYTDIIHNTVKVETPYSGYALYSYYGYNKNFYNNILYHNASSGNCLYIYGSGSYDSLNYNNYYSNTGLINFNSTSYSDLATWKGSTLYDHNSLSVNPLFKGISNLHVKEVSLNGAAKYFKTVPLDIDSETRDTLKPDIGADEFNLPPNDAGISHILIPQKPFYPDTQFVKVAIKNYGGNPLYVADIHWIFNGVSQTKVAWADTLASGDTMHVRLSKKYFDPDSAYSMKVWTSRPNGTGDSVTTNDTMQVKSVYPALSGVYTIGGSAPDFNTFTDAVNAMKRGGIIDSVRFDVRNGTYYEQISIPFIAGAGKANSIIFQSEQKDSSKVFLISNNSSSKNYTVEMDSAQGITFRYMSMRINHNNAYSNIFRLIRGCRNINIHDNNFIGRNASTTGDYDAIIYIYQTNSNVPGFKTINIKNNRFTRGSFGVYFGYGYSSFGTADDVSLISNIFEDQYYIGTYFYYVNNLTIDKNLIYHTNGAYSTSYGIYAETCLLGTKVTGNQVYNYDYRGLHLYNCDGSSGDSSLVANNFFHCRGNGNTYGMYIVSTDYLNVLNNNTHISSSNSSSYSFYSSYNTGWNVYSNSFVTSGAGYAWYFDGGTLPASNYNNFYTTGTNLNYRSGNHTTLSSWQTNTGRDQKSVNVDPLYVSATDLHVRSVDLDGKGRNHKYLIRYDIDNAKRDTIKPDIGADEFNIPSANDAGILSYAAPLAPFNPGSNKVRVYIKNYGSDSLKSATIRWSVNGVMQSNKSWTGKLKSGQSDTVTVGSYNFTSGKKHDFVFWTISPNGVADTTNYNDTLKKLNIYPGLKGVYTVYGTLPDYASLGEAFTALKLGGVIDTVWFKIRTGTYTINLTLEDYLGSSAKRPVYIEAQSGDSSDVVLQSVGYTDQIIFLSGADHIRFRKLTFSPSYYYAVRYENGARGLQFQNCHFKLGNYYYYNGYGICSFSSVDDSLRVTGCRFDNGAYGVYQYGYISSGSYEKGIVIEKNQFNNQYYSSVFMQYANAPKIRYNVLQSSGNSGNPLMRFEYTTNDLVISHNKLDIKSTYGDGISVYNHSGNSGAKGWIFNNFIALNGSSNYQEGLYLYGGSYVNAMHNSINVHGSNTGSYPLYISQGNNYDIRNNVITNMGGGPAISYNSAGFSQSNYNDIYTPGSVFGVYNGTNQSSLSAWKTATSRDANSLSMDPSYNSSTDLHTNLSSLDSACLPISGITDDIDLETRNSTRADIGADEFQSLPDNLGVSGFIKPASSCGLDSTVIRVTIFNYGNKSQVNFPVRYRIDAGSIISATVSDTIKPGKSLEYQFAKKLAVAFNVNYKITAWTDLSNEKQRSNDTSKLNFTNYSIPDTVKSMVPTDGTINMDYPVTLSWLPASGATKYDLYYWKYTDSKPGSPNVSNLTQISYQINSGLTYGAKYNWQVIARNSVCSTPGRIKSFTMRNLPDLVVQEVTAPKTAFSATNISVSWKTKNQGSGNASGTWYDAIYLSTDAVYDVTDRYLGAYANPSALNASQNYSNSATVSLPNGISGNYYMFVITDYYNHILEGDDNNNSTRDTGKMVVTLTPPPDLVVTSVTRPATAFSGSNANMTFVVKNKGTGQTRSGGWYDRMYLSTEKAVNSTSYYLGDRYHSGNLLVDSSYSVTATVKIPSYISGKYFFVVQTDLNNNEYEHASESNNVTGSDTIKVILTPPPDLIVQDVVAADTVSSSETISFKYNVLNDGGTSTGSAFYDVIYICPTSTFNSSISTYVATQYHPSLPSKDTSKVSRNIKIPNGLNGTYYLFVVTDYYNNVNEVSKEGNNVSSGKPVFIKTPDLIVARVVVSSTDSSGSPTPVRWTVKNQGKGADYQGTRTDSIFISRSTTWNRSKSTPIGSHSYTITLLPGDTGVVNKTVTIPDGYSGARYFYVYTDATNTVYEPGKDNNNTGRSNAMNVILSPYPDLKPQFTSYPDSSKAGAVKGIGFTVQNQGAIQALPNWTDRIYLSKDSTIKIQWDTVTLTSKMVYKTGSFWFDASSKVTQLGTYVRTTALAASGSYSNTTYFTLPADLSRGTYYYYIFSDADRKVYEHIPDTNNLIRSGKVFIDGYPPVDLRVNCPAIKDTMNSGSGYTLTYSVTNIGEAKTATGSWTDGFYLSTDSVWNVGDLLVGTEGNSKILEKDSTYHVTKSLSIPNGLQGNYYLIVKADISGNIKDVDTSNNRKAVCKTSGGAKLLRINLTPPPDLQITTWDIPATSTSGQAMRIKWTVENKGTGSTRSGAWMDQAYLSTDYTIDNTDYFLGEKRHTGNLAVNGKYNDSQDYYIPIDKTGNFIVILRTDGANVEYEHSNEGNNTVSSNTTASKAPPADLIVSSVTSPDSVISGRSVTISWKVKNRGSNPATGGKVDNVYLSNDSIVDATDKLLDSKYSYITLAPNSEQSQSSTVGVSGIALGNYHVLVSTDVLNNINESNDTNNVTLAANHLNVNVPILPIGVKTPDTLVNNEHIYHRIIVPDSLAGESMLIILKGDSTKGNNEIFVRHNAIASGSEFDFGYRDPFKGNQEIIIPELKAGTYYLLTTGKTSASTKQYITLLARIMPFEIRKVTPVSGGNTGEVTVLIEGSKLDDVGGFLLFDSLNNPMSILPTPERYSESGLGPVSTQAIDPTLVYATFNLNGFDTGWYDVVAFKNAEEARLVDGFKVVPGVTGELNITTLTSGNARTNNIVTLTVLFTNDGNTDLVNQKLLVTSTSGAPIALKPEDLSKNLSTLEITVQENGGPPNRLRPGGNGSVTIYSKASAGLGFTIIK